MFGNPWALLGLLLAAPVVWLYRRRAAAPEAAVATGALWQQVLAEQRFRSWWLPRRHAVSLAVQLVILAAAVLALAQPSFSPRQTTVLILDTSASMNAADVSPSRFETARRHARQWIDSLPNGDVAAILAGGTPLRLVCPPTDDRRQLRETLDSVAAGNGRAQVIEAVGVARTILENRGGGRVVVLTDACFPEASDFAEAADVDVYTVGGQAANVAVRRVAARRDPGRPEAVQVLVEVASFAAPPPVEIPLELRLDGDILADAPPERATGPHPATVYELLTGEAATLAVVAEYDDALPADNRGSASVPPAPLDQVALVGRTNPRVEAALVADRRVRTVRFDEVPPAPSPATIYVLQGEVPPRLPAGPLLVLGPRNACDLWALDGFVEHAAVARQCIESSILAGLDLEGMVFSEVGRLKLKSIEPDRARVLAATADGAPLLLALDRPEGRVMVVGGEPDVNELLHHVEFPALLAQSLRWLGEGPEDEHVAPHEEAVAAFPAGESDLRVPVGIGTPADRWKLPRRWPAAWPFLGALALAMLVSEWCLYQRRWIS